MLKAYAVGKYGGHLRRQHRPDCSRKARGWIRHQYFAVCSLPPHSYTAFFPQSSTTKRRSRSSSIEGVTPKYKVPLATIRNIPNDEL